MNSDDLYNIADDYLINESLDLLYHWLHIYNESDDSAPEGYVSDESAFMMGELVKYEKQIKIKLETEPLDVLESLYMAMDRNFVGIIDKGHFFLGDPVYENNDENNEIIGYENGDITEENLDQLKEDAEKILNVIKEVKEVLEYKKKLPAKQKERMNIAVSLGQSNLPRELVNKIGNYSSFIKPENKINFVTPVHLALSEKERKKEEAKAKYKNMFKKPNLGKPSTRCPGVGCSIMGGKRKSKKTQKRKSKKSKKTKRSKKH
jgi:hypothetical protein